MYVSKFISVKSRKPRGVLSRMPLMLMPSLNLELTIVYTAFCTTMISALEGRVTGTVLSVYPCSITLTEFKCKKTVTSTSIDKSNCMLSPIYRVAN